MPKSKFLRRTLFVLGGLSAVVTLFIVQRDFIYGAKGNLGQGTHPRF
jgi:hypothetical protein